MDVHHIIKFYKFDDFREANKLENLISLCPNCHKVVENRAILNDDTATTKKLLAIAKKNTTNFVTHT